MEHSNNCGAPLIGTSICLQNVKAKQLTVDITDRPVKRDKRHDAISKKRKNLPATKGKDFMRKLARNKSLRLAFKSKIHEDNTMMHRSKSHLDHMPPYNEDSSAREQPESFEYYRLTRSRSQSKIALSSIQQNHLDFDRFLEHEENVKIFSEFLKIHFCKENIDFWLECERFKSLFNNNKTTPGKSVIRSRALKIFKQYLGFEAKQPVNVNYECLQAVEKSLSCPTQNIFDDAQLEVFNLMRTDCYPRFCKQYQKRNQGSKTSTTIDDITTLADYATNKESSHLHVNETLKVTYELPSDKQSTNEELFKTDSNTTLAANSDTRNLRNNYIISTMRDSYPVPYTFREVSKLTDNRIRRAVVKNIPHVKTDLPDSSSFQDGEHIMSSETNTLSPSKCVTLPTKRLRRTPPPPPLPPRKRKFDESDEIASIEPGHVSYLSEKNHLHSKCKYRRSSRQATTKAINRADLETKSVFISQPVDV